MNTKNIEDYGLDYFANKLNDPDYGLHISLRAFIRYDTVNLTECFVVSESQGSNEVFYKYQSDRPLGSKFIDIMNIDDVLIELLHKFAAKVVLVKGVDTKEFFENSKIHLYFKKDEYSNRAASIKSRLDLTALKNNLDTLEVVRGELSQRDICFFTQIKDLDEVIGSIEQAIIDFGENDFNLSWNDFVQHFSEFYVRLISLDKTTKRFKDMVDFCLNRKKTITLSSGRTVDLVVFSPVKRLFLYFHMYGCQSIFSQWTSATELSENVPAFPSDNIDGIIDSLNDKEISLDEIIEIDGNYQDLFYSSFMTMVRQNILIAKCRNCGKLFIPTSRSDEGYCNNLYIKGKTCKELGYEDKIGSDAALKAYRTAYKTQNAKKLRNKNIPDIEERFKFWCVEAKKKLADTQEGEMPFYDFKIWLKGDCWLFT